jgi:hypothetical protein
MGTADGGTVLRFSVAICNASSAALDLKGYTMKYWYTADGASTTQDANIAYAPAPLITNTNPTATAALIANISDFRNKADAVLTLSFSSVSLTASTCTGAIQVEIHPDGWAGTYSTQTTDYSYLAATTLTDNPNITVYNDKGQLIWGLEPACVNTGCKAS